MGGDDRKLTYSERDRMRREGGGGSGRPRGGRAREEDLLRTQAALDQADALFSGEKLSEEGIALANAVRAAHGSPELPAACKAYLDGAGAPQSMDLMSIFLDAGDKELSLPVLDELLRQKDAGTLELEGGLKRQIRILSEDFDDDLASRAEDLLE
jgi:hypothetical protein